MPIVVHVEDAPLIEAVMRGNMPETLSLLRTGEGDIFRDANAAGDGALHIACRFGRMDFVKCFLRSAPSDAVRAHLNGMQNIRGQVPLHYAASYGMESIVEFIVKDVLDDDEDFGDPRAALDHEGRTPMDAALANGHARTAAILRDPRQAKMDAEAREAAELLNEANQNLLIAARSGDKEWCEELLDKSGAELNFLGGDDQSTPLIIAAANQRAETCHFLIERGADPMRENRRGGSAAHNDTSLYWHRAQFEHADKIRQEEEEAKRKRRSRRY